MTVNTRVSTIIFLILFSFACRDNRKECRIAQTGTFYYYPRNTNRQFRIIRTANLQTEIDLATGDSSFWRISWKSECNFSVSFIRNTRVMSEKEREFYLSHVLNCKILTIAPTYYIFKAIAEPSAGFKPVTDTIWLKEGNLIPTK